MRLSAWLKWSGYGAKAKLARRSGLTWQSIHEIATGKQEPKLRTAARIVAATGGEVTIDELLKPKRSRSSSPKRRRKRRRTLAAAA